MTPNRNGSNRAIWSGCVNYATGTPTRTTQTMTTTRATTMSDPLVDFVHFFAAIRNPAYTCPECGRVWTHSDDPDEWAYGHDCEVT